MYETTYVRARSLAEASALLVEHEEARPLSGGMTLIPTLKQRLAAPTHLIDLTRQWPTTPRANLRPPRASCSRRCAACRPRARRP